MARKRVEYTGPKMDARGVYHGRGGKIISRADAAREILSKSGELEVEGYRERLFNQRLQSARQVAYARGHDEDVRLKNGHIRRAHDYDKVVFNQDRDLRLQLFSATPREQRTRAQWKRFRQDMIDIYGEYQDDWGDYY